MNKKVMLLIIISFLYLSGIVTAEDSFYNDLDTSGSIDLITSWSTITGNQDLFLVQTTHSPGFTYDYFFELFLNGELGTFYLDSLLNLSSTADPVIDLTMENDYWMIEYRPATRPYELKLPHIETCFQKQELTGFKTTTQDNSFVLFSGEKSSQTRVKTIAIYDESKQIYQLFLSTDGDAVENSEKVFLNGRQLIRYQEYKFNYLSGELKLLIPLRSGSTIQVKYAYLPIGEEINDTLKGLYYQHNFTTDPVAPYVGAFFLEEKQERVIEEFIDFQLVEKTQKEWLSYLGLVANIQQRPWTFSGEIAATDPTQDEIDYAGHITGEYQDKRLALDYQFSTATPQFKGIGVVNSTPGEKHTLTGTYQFHPLWILKMTGLQNKQAQGEELSPLINQEGTLQLQYQFTPSHLISLSIAGESLQESGQTYSNMDYQLGWQYQMSQDLSVEVTKSLQRLQKGELTLDLDTYGYRFNTKYQQYFEEIPDCGERWIRELNTDFNLRPWQGVTVIGDLDYYQPFSDPIDQSRRRAAFTLLAAPNEKVNSRANFVYFYNPVIQSQTLFHDLNATLLLPGLGEVTGNTERIQINSATVINNDQNYFGSITIPFTDQLCFNYQLNQDEQEVFLKMTGITSQKTEIWSHTVTGDLFLNPWWTLQGSYLYRDSTWIINTSNTVEKEKEYSLSCNYLKNLHHFSYQIKKVVADDEQQLQHLLTWNNQFKDFSYHYTGQIKHSLNTQKILEHKENLEISYLKEKATLQPALSFQYQQIQSEDKDLEQLKLTGKLTYILNAKHQLKTEISHYLQRNYREPAKNYSGYVIKLGTQYNF